jgi:hypothetical protein
MKKLTNKSKRTLTVAGIGVVCVALIIGIFYRFSAENVKASDAASTSSSSSGKVVVAAVGADSASQKSSSSSASSASASSKATASSKKTDQVIQPDVSKPSAPSSKPAAQGSTTNPSKAPTYSSKETTSSQASEPSGGEKKGGKVYLPGFGWVTNTGGSGKTVDGSGNIHKQVGKMD